MANHERNLGVSPVKNYTGGVAADDIPDEIIHRIQSFMDARQAAHTTVLFKSWRRAWRTRPDLDFRDRDFQFPGIQFPAFARNTLQRYEDSKLRINSFRLEMVTIVDHELAKELILKAIRLGATILTLRIRRITCGIMFMLPNEVLDSETLAGLSAHECLLNLQFGNKEVSWSNLKTLNLSHVYTHGDLFLDLILKCTSLENITLDSNVSFPTLFRGRRLLSPSCDSIIKLHKLKSLQLIGLDRRERDNVYRHDLWPKFPWLKELVIRDVDSKYDWRGLKICSPSLEIITLFTFGNKITKGKFDVPNIRKFKVVGVHLPQLDEFKTSSNREWEADIKVDCDPFFASWFSSLSKLLRMLSPSRISVSVCMTSTFVPQSSAYSGDGVLIPRVENLSISSNYVVCLSLSRFSALLKALLQSCHPNCISVDTRFTGNVNLEALFQRLGYRPCERHDLSGDQQYLIKFQRI